MPHFLLTSRGQAGNTDSGGKPDCTKPFAMRK